MKKLMHIIATPREGESRTLEISEAFLESFKETHTDWVFDELNFAQEQLPSMTMKRVDGKYMLLEGKDLFGSAKAAWNEIIQHIERFITADLYVISTPMWNFSIPYTLKQYIDVIVQPKYLFRYTETGAVEGLAKNKKMVVIATHGGQYTGENEGYDFLEPYLRTIFGFVGITDITFIKGQPMDMGHELRKQKIQEAKEVARELGKSI